MTEQQDEQLAIVPQPEDEPLTYGSDDTAIVKIYHEELDVYGESPRAGVKFLNGWEIVDPTPEQAEKFTDYDPSAHSAQEVNDYLKGKSQQEVEAVLVLEREGKNRKSVHAPEPEPTEPSEPVA